MSDKLLLIHNSEKLRTSFKPWDDERPIFYWYTDRFASHIGTMNYIYFFLVNPKRDGVELKCREGNGDFDALHKSYIRYRDFNEGNSSNISYAEPGIAMTFSELKPDLILVADSTKSKDKWENQWYLILHPHDGKKAKSVKILSKKSKRKNNRVYPIKFIDIPEIVEALPEIINCLPIKDTKADSSGMYIFSNWKPINSHKREA